MQPTGNSAAAPAAPEAATTAAGSAAAETAAKPAAAPAAASKAGPGALSAVLEGEGLTIKDLPIATVLDRLQTSEQGLSDEEAARRLQQFGPNQLPEQARNPFLVFLRWAGALRSARCRGTSADKKAAGVCPLLRARGQLPVEPAVVGDGGRRHHLHRAGRLP